jgi:hypothetical protein
VHGNSTTHAPVVGSQHAGFSANTAVTPGLFGCVWKLHVGVVEPAQSPVLHSTKWLPAPAVAVSCASSNAPIVYVNVHVPELHMNPLGMSRTVPVPVPAMVTFTE